MPKSNSVSPRFRLNSIFIKLAVLIVASASLLTAITSFNYTRASLRQIEVTIAHSAHDVNSVLSRLLSGPILSRAPGPIEREFRELTTEDDVETRLAMALDAAGRPIASIGVGTEDEAALTALAQKAMKTGETQHSDNGMMLADPIINAMSGEAVGALATSWTAAPAKAKALRTQLSVIALAAVLVVVGVSLIMLVIRAWITRPMIHLADAVDSLASDDLDVTIDTHVRGDEIGDIGKAVETLRMRLRKSREEARENRFRGTAFASSSAAIMMVDSDMRIASMNQTVGHILTHYVEDFRLVTPNFDPDDVIGQQMDFFHAPSLRERVRALLMNPDNLPYKTDIAVGNARFNLVINRVEDATGALEGFVVEWNDITAQFMQTTILDAIEANQTKAEFGLDGTLLHANDLFAQSLGAAAGELVGRRSDELFDFDDGLSAERGGVFERLTSGDSVYGSFRLKRGDGREGVIDGGFTPVLDTAGRLLRIILIGKDMTEAKHSLKMAEAERAKLLTAQQTVVDALRNGLERLAEGDLTGRIETEFPDEYDRLRADFNLAADRLQEAMRGVIDNAELIQGEAAEISSAADDLSARTERQAATLEQTASALDELTSSVRSAADGASHANGLVESARENAEASGEVVRQAVEAMSEIETSSQQISKITGVIDDIAFQTNLLALNAGVEAARAGEAGRGFAVVASEVRALAQRSSEAAREINGLISASGTQVKRGVDLVDQAGSALKGIVESVKEISRNVNEIAVSSHEQSSGLGEINAAVNQLDQVTQQNAAMFEETTAASHALTREAETLARTMGRFKTGTTKADSAKVVEATFTSHRGATNGAATMPQVKQAVAGDDTARVADQDDDDGWDDF